jgi:hypothetical protein
MALPASAGLDKAEIWPAHFVQALTGLGTRTGPDQAGRRRGSLALCGEGRRDR